MLNVEMQLGSPDQAIKTWWKIRDLSEARDKEACEQRLANYKESSLYKYAKGISTGPAAARAEPSPFGCRLDVYNRDIIEVKVESDTRAVVLAAIRPATPVPAGAELTSIETKGREEGARYKYVLEKVGKEWKVAQLYHFENYGEDHWKPVFEESPKPPVHWFAYGVQ
jgi:hypothetical protein